MIPGATQANKLDRWAAGLLALVALTAFGWLGPVAPAHAGTIDLHRGSRGASVRLLEHRLNTLRLLPRRAVDRYYGPRTVRAVRTFQSTHHLRVTGRVRTADWNAIAAAGSPPPPSQPAPWSPPSWTAPLVIAHRGGRVSGIPENSMSSMHYASATADVLEFDLRETADHHLLVMHDGSLDRTTTCAGDVNTKNLADIQTGCALRVDALGGPLATTESIPAFDDIAAYAASSGLDIAPELKVSSTPLTDAALAEFEAVIDNHGLQSRTYVQSFDPLVFPRLQRLNPTVALVYLGSPTGSAVLASGAKIVAPFLSGLTAAQVAAYHQAGLRVWPWTAETVTALQQAWSLGADGAFTDLPAEGRALYGARR